MFQEYPGFKLTVYPGIKKPLGYRKRRSRLKADRSPVYLPTSDEAKEEAAQWLRPRNMR